MSDLTSRELKQLLNGGRVGKNGRLKVNKDDYDKIVSGKKKKKSKKSSTLKGKHAVRQSDARKKAVKAGFRSAFEQRIAATFNKYKIKFTYETEHIEYQVKPNTTCACTKCGSNEVMEHHIYTPDFSFPRFHIEAKGFFSAKDRKKHIAIKKCNPDVKILFVFQDPEKKLSGKSKTTYSKWANDNGFHNCDFKKMVPVVIALNQDK